jgi:uncharacterized protein (DUF1810 family)/uncharacterized protein YndB with AHSA1/START domain
MYSTRAARHIKAAPAAVYSALLSPQAVAHWRAPEGMTCEVLEFDPRERGAFRIALTYDSPGATGKSSAHGDIYHGHFERLVADEQVVEVLEFETTDPALQGEMEIATTLTAADGGTDVLVVHHGVPDGVPAHDNESGTREALANLAEFVERLGPAPEDDPFALARFVTAQNDGGTYGRAVEELRQGRKTTHWMWFVFPQIHGLGHSSTARRFAITSLAEARAYLRHPVLGRRLLECAGIVAQTRGRTMEEVFGPVDAMKLRSSMTLFVRAAPEQPLFHSVVERHFAGLPDAATDGLL